MTIADNLFHSPNYTIEMVSFTASKILGIEKHKKVSERSVQELVGLTSEEFLDSDRYETFIKRSPHILVFRIIFK
jgi:hypothetical protein